MGKGPKRQKKGTGKAKEKTRDEYVPEEDMDDEVDAFHKQRDIVPLEVDDNEDFGASDDDDEQPVFDFEDGLDEDVDDDDAADDDSDGDEDEDTGLAAKIARQQKLLRQRTGGVEDELHDDVEDEDEKKAVWGWKKNLYYNADNADYELQSSDDELPEEEEAEVLRLQKEKAKSLSMEDFGLKEAEQYETDSEEPKALEDVLFKGRSSAKPVASKDVEDDTGTAYEEVKKDINALSREEQMDVVYSSAPELVGLLSELNDAIDELERKVNPVLTKVEGSNTTGRGGLQYFKTKQLLLLSYCQAISFYLLLKSEGHPVRDHPVIARLVEIKSLLEKMKNLDGNLPSEIEKILSKSVGTDSGAEVMEGVVLPSKPSIADHSTLSAENHEVAMPQKSTEQVGEGLLKDHVNKQGKRKRQNDQVAVQSIEMLKIRARLEEKLKQKGVFRCVAPKSERRKEQLVQAANRKLETLDDFDDEVINKEAGARVLNGHAGVTSSMSQLVAANVNKSKVVAGDDDVPRRADIGERRRKHELQVLARAGVEMDDAGDLRDQEDDQAELDADFDDDDEGGHSEGSEDDLYKQVKKQRAAKLSAKAELYGRVPKAPLLPETEVVDGKRLITYQMEKNRGLTRNRKKLTKNPRKKYRLKHKDAVVRRKGQVRDVKKPTGPYGGEVSGINAGISRSVRFKN